MASVVRSSTDQAVNIPQLIVDPITQEQLVCVYKWSEFLDKFFKHIPHILSYQIFEVSSSKPGVLLLRKSSSSAIEEISILRNSANSIAIGQIPLSCSLSLSLMQQQQANASDCVQYVTVQVTTSARVHRSKHFNCCVHFVHSIGLDCVCTVL